jgi:hypothetical protein
VQVQYPLDEQAYAGPPQPHDGAAGRPAQQFAPGGSPQSIFGPSADEVTEPWIKLAQTTWEATWLASGSGDDALGVVTNDVRAKFEFPHARMFTVTPRLGWHLLDGPILTDLPGRLYDASVETVLSLPLTETLFMQAAISPSIFTDGQNTSGDALRLPGRLLFFWSCNDELTLSAGIVYLDRDDIGFLPSAGLIYKPSADWKIEMLIPRPRVAWRYSSDGDVSRWAYIVGELGGGSWAVERASATNDVATLSDYRLLLGWERVAQEGLGVRVEGGYVFNRALEYTSEIGNLDLPATALVRLALTY